MNRTLYAQSDLPYAKHRWPAQSPTKPSTNQRYRVTQGFPPFISTLTRIDGQVCVCVQQRSYAVGQRLYLAPDPMRLRPHKKPRNNWYLSSTKVCALPPPCKVTCTPEIAADDHCAHSFFGGFPWLPLLSSSSQESLSERIIVQARIMGGKCLVQ